MSAMIRDVLQVAGVIAEEGSECSRTGCRSSTSRLETHKLSATALLHDCAEYWRYQPRVAGDKFAPAQDYRIKLGEFYHVNY